MSVSVPTYVQAQMQMRNYLQTPVSAPPSPPLIIKKLPNGLTYYIQRHTSPPKRAMIWLAVNAGSLMEDEDQRGFAHFLEHMAFNGTKHFPGNSLIDVIEQAGMTFGSDLNAYTSFDETVYQLTIPTDDSVLFHQGLQIVQDWANGDVLNDSIDVVGERGVVMGEWRMRASDTASVRVQHDALKRTFGAGSRYVARVPIGDTQLIQTATSPPLQRFYHDWYRPDLMAVIAVGDFDPVQIEREIIARFGTIPKPVHPRPFDRPHVIPPAKTTVTLVKDNVSPGLDVMWPVAPLSTDSKRAMRTRLLEEIIFPYLQRIATRMSKRERRPFALALVGRSGSPGRAIGARYVTRVVASPDSVLSGTRAILTELERIAQHGIPSQALEREKAAVLSQFEQAASDSAETPSRSIATKMTQHFLSGDVPIWTADSALVLVKAVLPTITSTDVAEFARRWRADSARIVTVNIPKFSTLRSITEANVTSLLDSVTAQTLTVESPFIALDVRENTGFAHINEAPGTVTSTRVAPNSDVRIFTLSNGATVVLKPTAANPDEVIVHAYSQGGHSRLPDSLFYSPGRLVAMLMTASGGLGDKKHDELHNDLRTTGIREFSVELNAFTEEMTVRGAPRELEMMFQLMHLQFTNPTIDTIALNEWRRTGANTLRMSENDQLAARLGKHPRLNPPSVANVAFMNLEQAMRVYRDRFGDASDFTFYIVGATDSLVIVPLIERYLANLPSTQRSIRETPVDFHIKLPTTKSVVTAENPRLNAEQSHMSLSFQGRMTPSDTLVQPLTSSAVNANSTLRDARLQLQALSLILSRRLRQQLREEMAVTYSVGAPVMFYEIPDLRYAISINLLTSPTMIDTSTRVVWNTIHALQTDGPTDEELQIVHAILTRRLENAQQNNQWWISKLIDAMNQNNIDGMTWADGIPLFTKEQIRAAANQYLSNKIYQQSTVKPVKKDQERNPLSLD